MQGIPEDDGKSTSSIHVNTCHYYFLPCFLLFTRSEKFLKLTLDVMGSLITENGSSPFSPNCILNATDHTNRIRAIVEILILMHKDVKIQRILSSCKSEIDHILQNMLLLQVWFCTLSHAIPFSFFLVSLCIQLTCLVQASWIFFKVKPGSQSLHYKCDLITDVIDCLYLICRMCQIEMLIKYLLAE